jgi:capsular polysaccharide transport system permease protein
MSEDGTDPGAKARPAARADAPARPSRARPPLRALQGPNANKGGNLPAGGAPPASQPESRITQMTPRPAASRPKPSAFAVSPKVESGELAQPTVLPLTPATWTAEALRIDLAEAGRKRRRGFFLRMLAFVVLPTLLMAAYVYLYATPRYVSEFQLTYQNIAQPASSTGLLASLLGTSSGGPTVDMAQVLTSYLTSDTILQKIDKELHVRAHYSSPRIDWLDRLSPTARNEDFLRYFNRRLSVDDELGGYVVVDVEAFDPKFAQAMGTAMAAACDDMVAGLTARARDEEVRVTGRELKKTQDRLIKATVAITNFRNEHVDFNPTEMAGQLDSVVGGLETQLAQARATLITDRTFLSDRAPQIVTLKSQIAGLEKQIQAEKLRLATTGESRAVADNASSNDVQSKIPYSKTVAEWDALDLELKFATDSYLAAKQAYETALVNAELKSNYVDSFVKPNLPQRSTSPDPLTWIGGTFLVSLVAYALGSLVLGSFRDQAGV